VVSAATGDPMIGRVLGGRYRVLERIGAGGMGQVYRAAHTRIACTFAVKVVWGDLAYDPEMQARFLREAETASCLQSRYIVRVNDFGGDEGSLPYLVMEYLEGPSLHDVIVREARVEPLRAAAIAGCIARGLAHAHERGVVHRDLKPENVLLVREDDEADVVKLLDFGIARVQDGERLTQGGVVVGTPLYMSPEQFTGGAIDGRTDLYALGCVLYEMLAGQPPFDAPRIEDLTRLHCVVEAPSLTEPMAAVGAPPALAGIVARLLSKRPEHRFGSARELVQALSRMEAEPSRLSVVGPPPSSSRSEEGGVHGSIERAILNGAPLYNAGDHAGCANLYRSCAQHLLHQYPEPVAIAARLEAALRRAATRTNPTDAAWDLRYAFDDVLTTEKTTGAIGLADELGAFTSVAARREAEGRLDLLGDYEVAFARALARKLSADPARRTLAETLASAADHGDRVGGGAAAIHAIEPILSSLRSRGVVSATAVAPLSARPSTVAMSGAVADEIRERIVQAIRHGAPAFNEGKVDVCVRLYRQAAEQIASVASTDPGGAAVSALMRRAVAESTGKGDSDAAWVLRYAFDTVLAG
jgi:serine/threonine-protein kinase